jgi:hypothetical protein
VARRRYGVGALASIAVFFQSFSTVGDVQTRGPRSQPDTAMGLYAPGQHELYDGRFVIRGSRVFQAGTLN